MPTGQTIITNALSHLGLVQQGGAPNASDSAYGLTVLNETWDAWGIDEGLIYAQTPLRFALAANYSPITIGNGADFNTPRPSRIYKAFVSSVANGAISAGTLNGSGTGYAVNDTGVILGTMGTQATYTITGVSAGGVPTGVTINSAGTGYQHGDAFPTQTGGGQPGAGVGLTLNLSVSSNPSFNRNELKLVTAREYLAHHDLAASALAPDELYIDWLPDASGFLKLYLWPVQSGTSLGLELDAAVPFSAWGLGTAYVIPPGYQDAIEWALAFKLLAGFGAAVNPAVAKLVAMNGMKAEARIREMNMKNRQLTTAEVISPQLQTTPPAPATPAAGAD